MHCFVIILLKQLAIHVEQFLALHEYPRMKSDNGLISVSLTQYNGPVVKTTF